MGLNYILLRRSRFLLSFYDWDSLTLRYWLYNRLAFHLIILLSFIMLALYLWRPRWLVRFNLFQLSHGFIHIYVSLALIFILFFLLFWEVFPFSFSHLNEGELWLFFGVIWIYLTQVVNILDGRISRLDIYFLLLFLGVIVSFLLLDFLRFVVVINISIML